VGLAQVMPLAQKAYGGGEKSSAVLSTRHCISFWKRLGQEGGCKPTKFKDIPIRDQHCKNYNETLRLKAERKIDE